MIYLKNVYSAKLLFSLIMGTVCADMDKTRNISKLINFQLE